MDQYNCKTLQINLLSWFDQNLRSLPWRRSRSLYGTWISEIMLQQTMVSVVVPFWEKFMIQFPDVQALAAAPESAVLSSWAGLGYYRRARNLHKAARIIVDEYQGELPTSSSMWRNLPGIGEYASGAIASIGLGEVTTAIDANARRVLCRWFFDDPVLAGDLKPAALEKMAAGMIHSQRPGPWNEAVMELGATLCQASSAQCHVCPVLDQCKAGLAGMAAEIPPKKKTEKPLMVSLAAVVVRRGQEILLLPPGISETIPVSSELKVGREDVSGLHQGLWTLPSSPWYLSNKKSARALDNPDFLLRWVGETFKYKNLKMPGDCLNRASFRHSITRFRLNIKTWEVLLPAHWEPLDAHFRGQWIMEPFSEKYPVSNLVAKSLKALDSGNV